MKRCLLLDVGRFQSYNAFMLLEKRFYKPKSVSPEERERIVKAISTYLSKKAGIVFAYIYGSFINEKVFRDIDVAVFTEGEINELHTESDLSFELSQITGHEVEVRVINRAPVVFQMAVLREGKLLFGHREDVRTDFVEDVSCKTNLLCLQSSSIRLWHQWDVCPCCDSPGGGVPRCSA